MFSPQTLRHVAGRSRVCTRLIATGNVSSSEPPKKRPLPTRPRTSTATSPTPQKKQLRPYDLSMQLKRLAEQGDIEGAINRLRSVPRDAQNLAVWNTMISLSMAQQKYQAAYLLFVDMKRRGFSPDISTFIIMFKGLAQISDWPAYPRQLANAHALYDYYVKYVEAIKYHEPDNLAQLSQTPVVIYLTILGAAGDTQRMFDVYFAMDQEGPGAPDRYIFTAMLRAIGNRQESKDGEGALSVHDTAASDAKHVWLQVEKMMQKHKDFIVDSRLIAAALRALGRGRPNDQNLALDIIANHLGLTRPGHPDPFKLSPHLNLWTLDTALQVCVATQKHRLCVHFMRLVMDHLKLSHPRHRTLIDNRHLKKLIRAHAALASLASPHESSQAIEVLEWCLRNDALYNIPDIRPDAQFYHLVLMTCFRNSDWEGALKTFQRMTGIDPDSFDTSQYKLPPKVQKRPEGRNLTPDVETMSFIMRTAVQTKDKTNAFKALWLAEHVGIDKLLGGEGAEPFFRETFARSLSTAVGMLMDDPRTEGLRERIASSKARADEVVRSLGSTFKTNKFVLGNLSWTQEDDAVAFDLAARTSKPRSK